MSSKLSSPAMGRLSFKVADKINHFASKRVSSILKTLVLALIFAASINAAHFSFLDSVSELIGVPPERSIVSPELMGPMANFFTISPSSQSSTSGSANTFTWTFTATNSNAGGALLFTIPTPWTLPNTGGGNGTVAIGGTCQGLLQIVAQQISVDQAGTGASGSCGTGQTITISYSTLSVPTPASPPQTYTFISNFGTSPTVTVNAPGVPTTTTVVSSVNPSTYGQGVTFTATVSPIPSGGTVTFNVSGSPVCSGVAVNGSGQATCNTNAITVPGSPHAVTADYSGTTGFLNSSGSLSVAQTVVKANQIAALTAPSTVAYDGAPHSPTVACSGGGVAFNVLINGGGTQTNAGVYAVTASCPVNSNYNGGINLFAGNYTIAPGNQTATLTAPTTTPYDGSPHNATVSCSGGGAAFNITIGGAASQINAGSYAVLADCPAAAPNVGAGTGLSAGNYTITPINQTAAVSAPFSVPYNGSPHGASVACSGGGAAFNIATGGQASQTNVGVYGVTADCPAAQNYNATAGLTASGFFAITPASQTATVTAPVSIPYDGSAHTATVTCSGGGVATNILMGGFAAVTSAATYPVTADCPAALNYTPTSGISAGNFTITTVNQTASVTPPALVPYNGLPHSAGVTCSGGGVATNISTGGAASKTDVGFYAVTADCPAAPNYNAGPNLSAGFFIISPIGQTASVAVPVSISYDGSPHSASVTCSGGGVATNIQLGGFATQTSAASYPVTADCPGVAPNYTATSGINAGFFDITPINQTASVTAPLSVPYDGSPHSATVLCSGGGLATTVLNGGSATQTDAGSYSVIADCPSAAPNYNATSGLPAGTFAITAVTQTATVGAPTSVPYDGSPHSATVTCTSGGVATNIITGGAATQTIAGVYTVTADCPGIAPNYIAGSNLSAGNFAISPVSQTASVTAPLSVSYDGSPHSATVSCSGGGIATNILMGGVASQTSAAVYPVTADCPGAPNYTPTLGVAAGNFTITPINQTASVTAPVSIAFDTLAHSATVACSGGGVATGIQTGGSPTQTNAGSYAVVADCPAAPNYNATAGLSAGNFTITAIDQTASVTAPTSAPFDTMAHAAAVTCSGGGAATNILTGGSATKINAGVYVVTADCPAAAPNYNATAGISAGDFTITPISQTASVTAPLSVFYDGSPHSATVSCSGGGAATNILTGGSLSQTNAAVYPVTTDCPAVAPNYTATVGAAAGNFTITAIDQTATVTAPLSVPYDGLAHSATVSCSGGGIATAILTGGSPTQTNAGVYAVVANCPVAPNYNASPGLSAGSFTITAANQTATVAAPISVPYDTLAHGAAVTCSGGGIAANILTGGSATKTNAGVYAVTADCPAVAPNYNAAAGLAAGNFTITAANQTATVTAPLSVPYDGLSHSATVACSGGGVASNISTGGSPSQTNAGVYPVAANCPAAAPNYNASSGLAAGNFTIAQGSSSTAINCPASMLYTGAPITPCTTVVTRTGSPNTTTPITYGNNVNLGTATANATYPGDLNHTPSPPAPQASFQIVLCPAVSVPTLTIQTGSPVTVPINTTALPSPVVISADFTFTYDPTKLTPFTYPNAVTAGTVAGSAVITYLESPGMLKISLFDPAGFSGSGPLVNLHFNVTGQSASTPMSISGLLYNGGLVCTSTSNGTLNIQAGLITGQVTYAHSPFVAVPGVLLDAPGSPHIQDTTNGSGNYSLTGFGSSPYTVTPSKPDVLYNDSPLTRGIFANDATLVAQHVVGLITLNATQVQAAKVSGFPALSSFDAALIAQWIVNTTPANPLNQTGKWKFNPGNGGTFIVNTTVTQNYSAILMGDVSGGWPNPAPRPALDPTGGQSAEVVRASVPNVEAAARSEVTVPFRIDNLGGKGVTSYQFDVEYDPAVLAPVASAASVNGTFSDGLTVVSNSPESGFLKVAVFGALPVNGDGVYVNLRFTTIGRAGSTSPLTIREFRFNDGDDEVTTIGGRISVTAAANNGAINGKLSTAIGSGITNARVILTSSTGEQRSVLSGPMGYFSFDGLVAGETYTVSVQAKRYTFAPRTVSLADNAVTEINLTADQ